MNRITSADVVRVRTVRLIYLPCAVLLDYPVHIIIRVGAVAAVILNKHADAKAELHTLRGSGLILDRLGAALGRPRVCALLDSLLLTLMSIRKLAHALVVIAAQ